jgi:hypothetical protein
MRELRDEEIDAALARVKEKTKFSRVRAAAVLGLRRLALPLRGRIGQCIGQKRSLP